MDCSLSDSSVHEILQARILEWVAIPFSKGSSWPRDQTQISCIAGRFFTSWATREAQNKGKYLLFPHSSCGSGIVYWIPWLRVSHRDAIRMFAGAAGISRQENSLSSSLTWLLTGFMSFWPLAFLHKKLLTSLRARDEREREMEFTVFCNLLSEETAHHFYIFYYLYIQSVHGWMNG